MSIKENLEAVRREIPEGCTLIAVSKTQPAAKIMEAYDGGQRVFGENRAQELARKSRELPGDIEWHMIGHLQTNKVKVIAPFVTLIHSIDSVRLLEEVNRQAARHDRTIACLLQVHIAEEQTKYGFLSEEIPALIADLNWGEFSNVQVKGLMGMATFTDDEQQVRREFQGLRALFDKVSKGPLPPQVVMQELSMGMSGDYKIAIEEGSTMVRIGTAIFGERQQT